MSDDILQRAVQQDRRDPWLAVLLSKVFPGAGHIYGGAKARGIFFITITIALFLTILHSIFGFLAADNAQSTNTYAVVFVAAILITFFVSIYVYFDAYKVTKRRYPEEPQAVTFVGARKPWLAAFLSALIPGVGQLYNRQIIKGFALPVLLIVIGAFENIFLPLVIVGLLVYVVGIKDAYDTAEEINGTNGRFFQQEKTILLFMMVMLSLQTIPYAKFVKDYYVEAFKMPSGSMYPTLKIGDHFLLGKSRPLYTTPQRGDVVVFPFPLDPEKNFVKRVIGIGGDKIQVINGEMYINEKQVLSTKLNVQERDGKLSLSTTGSPAIYEERIGDATYRVQYVRDKSTTNAGPWLVPEDSVFVLGDSRDNSQDSRVWGPVKKDGIKGKAMKIYWSWDSGAMKMRWDRIGQIIH